MSEEIEFKFGVADEQALDTFARALGLERHDYPALRQRNSFFDSADARLRSRGLALRLRIAGGAGVLTIKGKGVPQSADGALLARFEAECSIELARAEAILAGSLSPLACLEQSQDAHVREGVESLREALAGAPLANLGGFENERTTLPPVQIEFAGRGERLVFELDRTTFPGGRVDCEIEAEIGPEVDGAALLEHLRGVLEQAGIDWSPAPSKLARFLSLAGAPSADVPGDGGP